MQNRWNPDLFMDTWMFATLAHGDQTYGGALEGERIAYTNHLASVAMELMHVLPDTSPCDADLALQCALLHDTIEDTAVTYEQLQKEFGATVADGVLALTKNETLPGKAEQMRDSLERIRQQPKEIWMVKLADRITNLYHPPFYWTNEKMLAYIDEAKVIYEALAEANAPLAKRLHEKIVAYRGFLRA